MAISHPEYDLLFPAPFACLGIQCDAQGVQGVDFLPQDFAPLDSSPRNAALAQHIEQALQHYFATRHLPPVPLIIRGSTFQLKVWAALQAIPYGSTRTYGQVAQELGTSPRAVGNACRDNLLSLWIPCHRVVAAHGLGGFMGGERAVGYKRWLLAFEQGGNA